MKVLITGAGGFIGGAFLRALRARPHRVIALASSEASAQRIAGGHAGVEVVSPWMRGGEPLDAALSGADVLFHLAWSTVPATADAGPERDVRENVLAGLVLLERAARAGVRRVVFLSSGGTVYGEPRWLPIGEDHPVAPVSPYGVNKAAFERHLLFHAAAHGYTALALRPGNVYGNTGAHDKPQGVIEHWMRSLAAGRTPQAWGRLDTVRDYIWVGDMVEVLLHVLDQPDVTGVLNVGTGIGTSLRDLARTMEHVTGMPVSLNAVAMHRRAVSANVLDPGLLRRTLGHGPTTPLPEGLSMMWRALRG